MSFVADYYLLVQFDTVVDTLGKIIATKSKLYDSI